MINVDEFIWFEQKFERIKDLSIINSLINACALPSILMKTHHLCANLMKL
jgi:hypothetical protein